MFKQNLNPNPKLSETKGFNSDSEYVELSQKFSTLTDGKFFRGEANARTDLESKPEQGDAEDEIE
jgi:hypothetical protein